MDVQKAYPRQTERTGNRAPDRIRDVVKFEVQENAGTKLADLVNRLRPGRSE